MAELSHGCAFKKLTNNPIIEGSVNPIRWAPSLAEKGRSGGALRSANSTMNFNDVLRSANLLTTLQCKGSGSGKLSQ